MSLQPENGLYDLVEAARAALRAVSCNSQLSDLERFEQASEILAVLTSQEMHMIISEDGTSALNQLSWFELGRCAVEAALLRGMHEGIEEFNRSEVQLDGLFAIFCTEFKRTALDIPHANVSLQQVRGVRHALDGYLLPIMSGRMSRDFVTRAVTEARISILLFTESEDDDPNDGESIAA